MISDGTVLLDAYKEGVLSKDELRMALGYEIKGNAALEARVKELEAENRSLTDRLRNQAYQLELVRREPAVITVPDCRRRRR